MAFRLVNQAGAIADPAFVNLAASGVVRPGEPVEWTITSGSVVGPVTGVNTTQTALFGVAMDYAQGASDVFAKVIPFSRAQVWEVDCANAATTAQIGIRQYLSASRGYIHNQATDTSGINRVFLPIGVTSSGTGSGKLIGHFLTTPGAAGL